MAQKDSCQLSKLVHNWYAPALAPFKANQKTNLKGCEGTMPMDVENFVNQEGRAEKVKEVRKKIDELGIEYLYLQFVSVTGKIMARGSRQTTGRASPRRVSSSSTAPP